jgi:hypothetical protein
MIDGGFYITPSTRDDAQPDRRARGSPAATQKNAERPCRLPLPRPEVRVRPFKAIFRSILEADAPPARTAASAWYALHCTGIKPAPDANASEAAQASAYRYLGSVPVSPDGLAYKYDAKCATRSLNTPLAPFQVSRTLKKHRRR